MRLDSSDLRLLVSIAESGSLSKGAARVHLSSAAASERLKSLEGRLERVLFYRNTKGLTLTLAGEIFVRHARVMLRQMDAAAADLQELDDDGVGHLRIFANTSAVTEFMPEILGRFMAQRPRVTVDLVERGIRDVIRGVTDGSVDFGIVAGTDRPPHLESIHFFTDHMVLVVPEGHPLAGRGPVRFADTFRFPHVTLQDNTSYAMFMKDVAGESPEVPMTRIQLRSFEAMCSMIAAGVGVGVMPESAVLRNRLRMPLAFCHLEDAWALRQRHVIARDLQGLSRCATALIREIVQHFADRGVASSATPKPDF